MAGLLLLIYPSVIYGGVYLLSLMMNLDPGYMQNELRQNLFRAGHAHAGVLLLLSLVVLRYVDEARLAPAVKGMVRLLVPLAAVLLPSAFFASVWSEEAQRTSGAIYLAFAGAVSLAVGLFTLGVGLVRRDAPRAA
ncbi:MAG TPA: hypothetical protein VK447_21585 [Myxococcaceae bacterium]|nr:hypothetical protein [Myxococcaceae bacterium]